MATSRRGFLGACATVILAVAGDLPLPTLQRWVRPQRLREYVAVGYLRWHFLRYCYVNGRVPALVKAGDSLFWLAVDEIEELQRERHGYPIVYSYPGIPHSVMFKGVPMVVHPTAHAWALELCDTDDEHPFRRDSSSF